MLVLSSLSFIGRKVLVDVPKWSKFENAGARFGANYEYDITDLPLSYIFGKLFFEMSIIL
jgi:hypothetical protein